MPNAPFPIQPELTAIAIAVQNRALIADLVLPRAPVGRQQFKYLEYNLPENFTLPDTRVGRKGTPNQVEFTATEKEASTVDYGLDDVIPQADIDNKPENFDPVRNAVEGITNLVLLDREVRVAGSVFALGTYNASNRQTLSGTSQFSDFANSDPISVVSAALDVPLMRPNVGVIGQAAWTKLRQHPKIVKAVLGNSGDAGMVSARAVADLFELDELLIGQGFINSAKKGQTASYGRIWGKHFALLHINKQFASNRMATFGFTAQWGTKVAGSMPVADGGGLRGGVKVRSGESIKEVICAPDLGYFLQNVVA